MNEVKIRPEVDHLLEGRDRFVVAAEFDLGVADHTVGRRVIGVERRRLAAPFERLGKIVAGQCERAESDEGVEIVFVAVEGLFEERFGFRVVAGVAGFAGLLQIGETEERRRLAVVRVGAQCVL